MKHLKKFESNNKDWCDPNDSLGIEIRNTIKDILTDLVEDGIYAYKINFNNEFNVPPHIFIYADQGLFSDNFEIEEVQPFVDQIVSYLNSEGFKTHIENFHFKEMDTQGVDIFLKLK